MQPKVTWVFYLHVILVILGLVLPFVLPYKYIKGMLIFLGIIVLHWLFLNGECILTYIDRKLLGAKDDSLEDAFFYKLFVKFFNIKLNNIQSQMCGFLIIFYQVVIYSIRIYYKK